MVLFKRNLGSLFEDEKSKLVSSASITGETAWRILGVKEKD